MSIFNLSNLLRYFLVSILAIYTLALSPLNAMEEDSMDVEYETNTFQDLAITQKMLFEGWTVNEINHKFSGNSDVRKLLLYDLIWLHKITKLSCYLKDKVSKKDLDAILTEINQQFITYGHTISAHLLKAALDEASVSILDIRDKWNATLLYYFELVEFKKWYHSIKIILCAAGDKALDLIYKHHPLHGKGGQVWPNYTPWFYLFFMCQNREIRENVVNMFMSFADDDESKEALLCADWNQWTALHIAASVNFSAIFEKLMALASTVPGLVEKLLAMTDVKGKTVQDFAAGNQEIINIINRYR